MAAEVFKEMRDLSISELETVISLAKEELTKRRAARFIKLREDFMTAYNALIDEGISVHYMDTRTEEDIYLERDDCFYFD